MEQAYSTLGIDETRDKKAVAEAYKRLARIYHPDRFTDQPADVREEAERRMKRVTAAYELLRSALRDPEDEEPPTPAPSIEDLWQAAERYRQAAQEQAQEKREQRKRWERWERVEQEAQARTEMESKIAAGLTEGSPPAKPVRAAKPAEKKDVAPAKRKSALAQRLDEAHSRRQLESGDE